jgi:hypothetical protein
LVLREPLSRASGPPSTHPPRGDVPFLSSSCHPSIYAQPSFFVMWVSIPGKGTLQGSTLLDSPTKTPKCHRFSAVPYALPPTGNRRWRKPDPLPPTFSYGAKGYIRRGGVCPQPRVSGVTHDEDCLQSNIYVPIGTPPPSGWPVIFYIRELPFHVDIPS